MSHLLHIKNISISVQDKQIIKTCSLTLEPGLVYLLMGPNGSGKSTLARTVIGDPTCKLTGGSLFFDGKNISSLSVDQRARAGVFLSFQHPIEIPGLSVFSFLKESYGARFKKNITAREFRDLLYKHMAVLDIDQSFAFRDVNVGFSGGEKKRLELLQLLVLQPRVAILDEIDSGLDVDALTIVAHGLAYARKKNPQMALLIISHYQQILQHIQPDHVHVFCNGTIKKSGGIELATRVAQDGYDAFI